MLEMFTSPFQENGRTKYALEAFRLIAFVLLFARKSSSNQRNVMSNSLLTLTTEYRMFGLFGDS